MNDPGTPYVRLASRMGGDYTGDGWASVTAIARRIITDPQAHIDALAEAGVLMRTIHGGGNLTAYESYQVVAPHVHEWRVTGYADKVAVAIVCDPVWGGCGERRDVRNRLPIDVPE